LGYKKFLENQQFQFISSAVYHNDYGKIFSALNNPQYNLFNDAPFSFPKIYKKIYEQRPNDIFILTLRNNAEKWAKSVINFYELTGQNGFLKLPSYIETQFTDNSKRFLLDYLAPMIESWDIKHANNLQQSLIEVYENHREECINFFENKPNFFVVEIEKKSELKKLSDWLGVENHDLDFPWINKNPKL
jgi:hypothetical protein